MHYEFNKDLFDGKRGEVIAQSMLRPDFGKLEIVKGKCEFYDLVGRTTVEVKTDIGSKRTGNFALEYQKVDRTLTGISVSQAEFYFIICYDKEFISYKELVYQKGWWVGYLIETENLKALAHRFSDRKTVGGDDNKVKLILIPVDELRELSCAQYPVK